MINGKRGQGANCTKMGADEFFEPQMPQTLSGQILFFFNCHGPEPFILEELRYITASGG